MHDGQNANVPTLPHKGLQLTRSAAAACCPQANVELYRDERSGFSYRIPDTSDIDMFRAAIETLPGQESPEIYGLHPNADLTFRTLQVGRWKEQRCI